MSQQSVGICIYCGEEKPLTRDHVPSSNLFTSGEGVDFRFVWICLACNRGYSRDEEFFRNWLVNAHYETSEEATKIFDGPITRAYTRRPALAQHFFDNMKLVEIYNPTTRTTQTKTAITNNTKDKLRITRVVSKYVKGLASWHFGERINTDMRVEIVQVDDTWLQRNRELVGRMPLLTVKKDVFEYKYGQIPDTQFSMWLIEFYSGTFFAGFIADDAFFNRQNKN